MSKSTADDLNHIRLEIDQLDQDLLHMIEARLAIADRVANSKGDAPLFRPGREADILRQLASTSNLTPSLIEAIWRQIMAANLARQKTLRLILADANMTNHPILAWRFGAGVSPMVAESADAALQAVKTDSADIALLPHWREKQWGWSDAFEGETRAWLVAVAPFFVEAEFAPLALFARHPADPSYKDVTVIWEDGKCVERSGHDETASQVVGVFQIP
jgi:chorismate mutase/prephenate dehydratase